ncbi:YlaI family protein [Salirhabdus salicampi]|uniref:YlaI family protein n=1 Tax=Salirhabdus salicampi TaxID=476102 RepID=UPI0020C287BB|nr:YlaI family protein [Salirhabdus salicampi]MCP8616078.1 YlaI family protein [Salirhabdus salicampi]
MRVKCILCDQVDNISATSLLAKQLRKRRVQSYMCTECRERIEKRTEERKATGNFILYREKKKDDYI